MAMELHSDPPALRVMTADDSANDPAPTEFGDFLRAASRLYLAALDHGAPANVLSTGAGVAGHAEAGQPAQLDDVVLAEQLRQLEQARAEAERLALTDDLTGLANRNLLTDRLAQGIRHLERNAGFIGVLMLDLDHFKVINDTLGHKVGDAVLVEAARRLRHLARPDDTVARMGGDEFVIVVEGIADPADLGAFADRIVAGLRAPYHIEGEDVVTTVSVGIAVASEPESVVVDLLHEADVAMYRAKSEGRDRHEVYGAALQVRAGERLETERLVRRALAEDTLIVEYQPIVDVASGRTVHAEALMRIEDGERGSFPPEHFLEVAREVGLLPAMDERLRHTALGDLARWRADPSLARLDCLAVNLTARELANPDFTSRLVAQLGAAGVDAGDLCLEVTENVLMQTAHSTVASLVELRALGIHIGLDDFGTGVSALSYLRDFPLDFIKIHHSVVAGIAGDAQGLAFVAAIIDLAHALGLAVVAEGVEQAVQLDRLRELGCDRAQGYLFAASLPPADFASRLA